MNRRGWVAVYALALTGAFAPIPATLVEGWYSRGFYAALQPILTTATNVIPFAVFDVVWIGLAAAFGAVTYRCIRSRGWLGGARHLAVIVGRATAVVYLVFLVTWGLNYRRQPLIDKLAFEPGLITRAAASRLGDENAATLNALHAQAHASSGSLTSLSAAFAQALGTLGAARAVVPGRPKGTLLGGYFHATAVAGMTDPFMLETMIAPDLLAVERPFVIAHEWAHLAGYADESEANFVAWLTCRRGDAAARYSAALALIGYAAPGKPIREALDLGPRTDLYAIGYRYSRTNETLRLAAREGYDKFLKANRVERGVESYDAVVQLILGARLDSDGNPRLR